MWPFVIDCMCTCMLQCAGMEIIDSSYEEDHEMSAINDYRLWSVLRSLSLPRYFMRRVNSEK